MTLNILICNQIFCIVWQFFLEIAWWDWDWIIGSRNDTATFIFSRLRDVFKKSFWNLSRASFLIWKIFEHIFINQEALFDFTDSKEWLSWRIKDAYTQYDFLYLKINPNNPFLFFTILHDIVINNIFSLFYNSSWEKFH